MNGTSDSNTDWTIIPPSQQNAGRKEEEDMSRRRYQKGSLKLRGKRMKVWVARWRIDEVTPSGGLIRKELKRILGTQSQFPTKRLAQRALDDVLAPLNSLNYRPLCQAITCTELLDKWEKTVLPNYKPSTGSSYRSMLKVIRKSFGSLPLAQLNAEALQCFIASSTFHPKTLRNCVGLIRLVWSSARAWGYVGKDTDPFAGLVFPRNVRSPRVVYTASQVQNIVARLPEPYDLFFMLAAETGMRAGELCGLRVEDVEGNKVSVRQTVWNGRIQSPKSNAAHRVFNVSPTLHARLVRHLEQWSPNPLSLLFATDSGRPWDANFVVKKRLRPVLVQLGYPRSGLHAFRHTNETLMDGLNVPMKTRQVRLGHADAQTTMNIYTHFVTEDDRKTAEELGRVLWPNAANSQVPAP